MTPTSSLFELLIATHNPGKAQGIVQALSGLPIALRSLNSYPHIDAIDESGTSYEENAMLKARNYYEQTGIVALADDSGLEVDALNGAPGVFSARYGGGNLSDAARTAALLSALSHVGEGDRTARFVCYMVLFGDVAIKNGLRAGSRILATARGACEGTIALRSTGTSGFGFDPIFVPVGYNSSFAALLPEVKAKISHRAQAAKEMRYQLQHLLSET